MRHALGGGGQVILLLNRRGFSTHMHCPACGHVETCRFCDLALTFHRERDVTLCHHCGYEQEPPALCPKCGQSQVRYQGLGTEKLQAEIEEKFPGYVVQRMDSDKDGFVSKAEFMAQAERNFARCDLDKDGRINTAECRQALRRPSATPARSDR